MHFSLPFFFLINHNKFLLCRFGMSLICEFHLCSGLSMVSCILMLWQMLWSLLKKKSFWLVGGECVVFHDCQWLGAEMHV